MPLAPLKGYLKRQLIAPAPRAHQNHADGAGVVPHPAGSPGRGRRGAWVGAPEDVGRGGAETGTRRPQDRPGPGGGSLLRRTGRGRGGGRGSEEERPVGELRARDPAPWGRTSWRRGASEPDPPSPRARPAPHTGERLARLRDRLARLRDRMRQTFGSTLYGDRRLLRRRPCRARQAPRRLWVLGLRAHACRGPLLVVRIGEGWLTLWLEGWL